MSITMLPRAGMDCRTVDTIICRFFRNLHQMLPFTQLSNYCYILYYVNLDS